MDVVLSNDSDNPSSNNYSHFFNTWITDSTVKVGVYDLLCSLPGITANLLFIIVVLRDSKLKKSLSLVILLSFSHLLISLAIFCYGISDIATSRVDISLKPLECFFKRPQLSLFIVGTQLEACVGLLVALERTVAIRAPYYYFKMRRGKAVTHMCFLSTVIALSTYVCALILAIWVHPVGFVIKDEGCWPALVSGVEFGALFYAVPALTGSMAIVLYGFVVFSEVRNKRDVKHDSNLASVQIRHQVWIVKICCIFACTSFVFVVIPYSILCYTRYHTDSDRVGIWVYLRRYVTFALSANSFLGVALCYCASPELRNSTNMCKGVKPGSIKSANRLNSSKSSKSVSEQRDVDERV